MIDPPPRRARQRKAPGERGNLNRGLSVPGGIWRMLGNAASHYKRRAIFVLSIAKERRTAILLFHFLPPPQGIASLQDGPDVL